MTQPKTHDSGVKEIERLLNETEAASILNVPVKNLQQSRWKGSGPRFIKIGRLVRYEPNAIAAFIASNRKINTCNDNVSEGGHELA